MKTCIGLIWKTEKTKYKYYKKYTCKEWSWKIWNTKCKYVRGLYKNSYVVVIKNKKNLEEASSRKRELKWFLNPARTSLLLPTVPSNWYWRVKLLMCQCDKKYLIANILYYVLFYRQRRAGGVYINAFQRRDDAYVQMHDFHNTFIRRFLDRAGSIRIKYGDVFYFGVYPDSGLYP